MILGRNITQKEKSEVNQILFFQRYSAFTTSLISGVFAGGKHLDCLEIMCLSKNFTTNFCI